MRIARRAPLARVALALCLLLAGAPLAGSPAPAAAGPAPAIQVAPTLAAPGELVRLTGAGWPAGAALIARIWETADPAGPSALVASATADAAGGFSTAFAVPATLPGSGGRASANVVPGAYTVGASTEGGAAASAALTIGATGQRALLWGEVYLDLDENGQRDPGDAPAAAEVTALNAVHASPLWRTTADSGGRYAVQPTDPGYFAITARHERAGVGWSATAYAWVVGGQATRVDLLLRPTGADVAHPERCFAATGFCVGSDGLWDYFTHRGGVATFGYPVSRTFTLLGRRTQFFQRLGLQEDAAGAITRLNLLDPGWMPYNRINGATFPVHDPAVASAAPPPPTPDYGQAVLLNLRTWVPDEWEGLPVGFRAEYLRAAPVGAGDFPALVALEVWGFPTSRPVRDPSNAEFVYQRFQRGFLHYQGRDAQGKPVASGILLADWFKALITGQGVPPDLEAQATADHSPFLRQYCPGQPNWLCRPSELPDTDLANAFERQR